MKDEVQRGSYKSFEVTIRNRAGVLTNPDSCQVRIEKSGSYTPDSQFPWTDCSLLTLGIWGVDYYIPKYITLGDWVAHFRWTITGQTDEWKFEFTIIRADKPWDSREEP